MQTNLAVKYANQDLIKDYVFTEPPEPATDEEQPSKSGSRPKISDQKQDAHVKGTLENKRRKKSASVFDGDREEADRWSAGAKL